MIYKETWNFFNDVALIYDPRNVKKIQTIFRLSETQKRAPRNNLNFESLVHRFISQFYAVLNAKMSMADGLQLDMVF